MWPFLLTLLWQLKRGQLRLLFEYHDFLVQSKGLFDVGLLYGCMDKNDQSFFDMVPIWNSSIACNDGGSIGIQVVCSLWAFSADFRVLWVSPLSWHSAVLETPTPFSRVR